MQKGHAARGVCLGRTSIVCIVDWGHMFPCDRSRGMRPVFWLQAKRGASERYASLDSLCL